jgi:dTDP-4-dehydrorhamnose reductase
MRKTDPNAAPTILVTGVNGQVGFELLGTLQGLGRVVPCDRATLDLSDTERVRAFVRDVKPSLIVNPAAYTAVDQAENDVDVARRLNADVPRVFAERWFTTRPTTCSTARKRRRTRKPTRRIR